MHLLDTLARGLQDIDDQQLRRRRRIADTACAPQMRVSLDGDPRPARNMLAFCSNDYLGLAAHPALAIALAEGAALYGVGSGASHLISGHSRAHAELEHRLADFMAPHLFEPRALYFCTGYMANLAVITALGGAGSAIFCETLNHASLIDGARLARGTVSLYPHCDHAALAAQLAASEAPVKLIVTDSVFSMDGDMAPLPELLALAERHGAWLVVDDAHGFGVLGAHGRGALEHFGLRSKHLVYMGTLGKAAGVGGAFVAAHDTVIEWLVNRARSYIYTTAAAPALAHTLLTSLDLIAGSEGDARRAHLRALITQLRTQLSLRRWRLGDSRTAVQPVIIGPNDEALRVAAGLDAQQLWVPAIRPPTVPPGTARLRIALSAAHTRDEVARLADALLSLEQPLA